MSEWMPRGFRIPPYCNQSGMDRIRELQEQVKSQQAELDAARDVVERVRWLISQLPPEAGSVRAVLAAIERHNAARAEQEES